MLLNRRWQRPFFVKTATSKKDAMGAVKTVYSDDAVRHMGSIQPETDTVILEAYGAVEKRLYNIYTNHARGIKKLDGVCFGVPETEPPNFEVVSVLPWPRHVQLVIRGLT